MPIMLRLHPSQNKKGPFGRLTRNCVAVQPARQQKRSMTLPTVPIRALLVIPVALACLATASPRAGAAEPAFASPWSEGANSRARLLAAGGPEPGAVVYRAGIEI